MALVNLETYNSFQNIDSTYNNCIYSPDKGTTWFNINVPEGSYEIVDTCIDEYEQRIMKENGHYAAAAGDGDVGGEIYPISIQPNNNIDANYKVDFTTSNSFRTVLGFNSQIYSAGYNESENIVNIMNVNTLYIPFSRMLVPDIKLSKCPLI